MQHTVEELSTFPADQRKEMLHDWRVYHQEQIELIDELLSESKDDG